MKLTILTLAIAALTACTAPNPCAPIAGERVPAGITAVACTASGMTGTR